MDTPQKHLSAVLASLAPLHAWIRGKPKFYTFRELTIESLSCYPDATDSRLSTFTSDGLPFELSLSLSKQSSGGLRCGIEVGDLRALLQERLTRSHGTFYRLLAHIGAASWQDIHQRLFETIFPQKILALSDSRFVMWQGMVHRPICVDTLKVYYNLRASGLDVASVLAKILDILCVDLEIHQLREMAHHLPEGAQMILLGMDYAARMDDSALKSTIAAGLPSRGRQS